MTITVEPPQSKNNEKNRQTSFTGEIPNAAGERLYELKTSYKIFICILLTLLYWTKMSKIL